VTASELSLHPLLGNRGAMAFSHFKIIFQGQEDKAVCRFFFLFYKTKSGANETLAPQSFISGEEQGEDQGNKREAFVTVDEGVGRAAL